MSTTPARESPLAVASHVALWPTLYVLSAAICFIHLAGLHAADLGAAIAAGAVVVCNAAGAYLLDRVKLRDDWFDPADAIAGPARDRFMRRNARLLRPLVAVLLAAGGIAGWLLWPWLALAPILVVVGITAYAGRPRTQAPRLKDVLLVKNGFVAGGITAFVAVVALAASSREPGASRLWNPVAAAPAPIVLALFHVFLRVVADAVLCDLDDERADRRYRTSTLPVVLGRDRAWRIAMSIRLALAAGLLLALHIHPVHQAVAWSVVTVLTTVLLRLLRPARLRDWVDARFPLEAGLICVYLSFSGLSPV